MSSWTSHIKQFYFYIISIHLVEPFIFLGKKLAQGLKVYRDAPKLSEYFKVNWYSFLEKVPDGEVFSKLVINFLKIFRSTNLTWQITGIWEILLDLNNELCMFHFQNVLVFDSTKWFQGLWN